MYYIKSVSEYIVRVRAKPNTNAQIRATPGQHAYLPPKKNEKRNGGKHWETPDVYIFVLYI